MATPAEAVADAGPAVPRRRLALARPLGLVLLAMLPMLPSIGDPLVGDDYLHITRLQEVRSGSLDRALRTWTLRADDSGTWWTPPSAAIEYLRPLVSLSFLADHALWGERAAGYRLTNILLHAAATLLCFGLAREALGRGQAAWIAAAFFALHPCHTEAVLWVSARTDLMATVCACAAVLLHARARRLRLQGPRAWAPTLLFVALALFAKETAIVLPLLLLAWELWFPSGEKVSRRLLVPALAALTVGGYLLWRLSVLGHLQPPPSPLVHRPGEPGFAWHVLSSLALYVSDLVLFVPLDAAIAHPFWTRHWVWLLVLAAAAASALAWALAFTRNRRPGLWGLGWTFIALALVLPAAVGERYLYLPSVGYCIFMAARVPPSGRLAADERRALLGTAALVLAVTLGKVLFIGHVARESRRPIDDALAELSRAPRGTLLLAADLPVTTALAFPHAVRLGHAGPVTAAVLSVAPDALPRETRAVSVIECPGPGRIVLRRRESPFFRAYTERAFLGGRAPLRAGDTIARPGYTVRVLDASQGEVSAFEVRTRPGTPVLLLQGYGFRLRKAGCGP